MTARATKITFGELRSSGVHGIIIYCANYECSHSVERAADAWADSIRLSDIEPHFVCSACGRKGADVRPNFQCRDRPRPSRNAN